MKKISIILLLIAITLFSTACGEPKTELDALKKYLENSLFYTCKANICTKKEQLTSTLQVEYEYNFDTNTYTQENISTSDTSSSIFTYNWSSGYMTNKFEIDGVSYDITFDYFTNNYQCNSKTPDEIECQYAKEDMKKIRSNVIETFTNSNSNYFIG